MKPVQRIPIKTASRNYNVIIGSGVLADAGPLLCRELRLPAESCVVISSANVWKHWGETLAVSLDAAKLRWNKVLIPDGEPAKRLATLESAAEQMLAFGCDRSTLLLAFGGGVIGDIGGFLAASYMRGLRYVQIPTTLLAQVDASIGGKTGVNLEAGKNLLGSFHQPECVLVDPDVLSTLDHREYRAGLYEVIKSGAIADAQLFFHTEVHCDRILARDREAVLKCVEDSVRVKGGVVSQDERETGIRRHLNFGHTIGHALEAETHYDLLLHGEAVAWGMIAAARIAADLGRAPVAALDRIQKVVLSYGALPAIPAHDSNIVARVASDKKTVSRTNHFVVVPQIGRAEVVSNVPQDIIAGAVAYVRQLSHPQA
jgi:3-dehydroquinate synthase